ncbi:type II secretion system F family protein, partial [Stenotrophomonas maltophilia]|uniref:type II secretion system F family protein n=3 Tax=Pseudomonadota TaxID=1224 RepID=UPI001954A19A
VLGETIARVADGVKEGGGLTAPLAASGALPRLAIGFLRTGEETSQLGMMLGRLADVLDRDIRLRIERLIGILTPVITVVLGATVASIIAAI